MRGTHCQCEQGGRRVPIRAGGFARPWAVSGHGMERFPRPFSPCLFFIFIFLFFFCRSCKTPPNNSKQLLNFCKIFSPICLNYRERFDSSNSQNFGKLHIVGVLHQLLGLFIGPSSAQGGNDDRSYSRRHS
jgi:hypothetical protein